MKSLIFSVLFLVFSPFSLGSGGGSGSYYQQRRPVVKKSRSIARDLIATMKENPELLEKLKGQNSHLHSIIMANPGTHLSPRHIRILENLLENN